MRQKFTLSTEWGKFIIVAEQNTIVQLHFPGDEPDEKLEESPTPLLKNAGKQLMEYLGRKRHHFELPLNPTGTTFQRKVWQELCNIPYGEVATYGEIAERIGLPGGARAVGQANHRNPLPILIPCHRVVAANRKLGGYGAGLDLKIKLLNLEGIDEFGS